MSGDPLDMTGLWHGTYSYVDHAHQTMPFAANIVDHDGHLSGSIMEPASEEEALFGEEIEALIAGARGGQAVDFTKTYAGKVWTHAVDYVGRLSSDGQTVTGMWSVDSLDGIFEMHRDLKLEDLAGEEEAAEVVVETEEPVLLPRAQKEGRATPNPSSKCWRGVTI